MKKKADKVQYMWRMSVRPSYSVAFLVRADGLPPSRRHSPLPKNNSSNGVISKKAATKINNAVQWLLMFSHKKRVYSKATRKSYWFLINFITLTLSDKQNHSDEYVKEHMLYPFLRWMARAHKAGLYIWKAEAQTNGNIHFHITTNTFIHWKSIRRKWNEIQSRHGYMKKWTDGNERGNPNSTDVHAVIKTDQIAKYMVKYMVKTQTDRRPIDGRLWACSQELSQITVSLDEHDNQFAECSADLTKQSEIRKLDHATLLLHQPLNKLHLHDLLRERLTTVYKSLRKRLNSQTYFTIE